MMTRITIESIQAHVATSFGVSLAGMMSYRRPGHLVRPRQVAMYLARRITGFKLSYVAHKFGKRDHTTIGHAVKNIESMMAVDPAFAARVNGLRGALELAP